MTFLCSSIGKYPTFLSCVRNGTDRIDEDQLSIIAAVLGTTTEYLTNETDTPEPASISTLKLTLLLQAIQTMPQDGFNRLESFVEGLQGGYRDFIFFDELSTAKQIAVSSLLEKTDCEVDEIAELIGIFERLDKSGRRQLMGKAYELLDRCNTPPSDGTATPPNLDMAAPFVGRRIKK